MTSGMFCKPGDMFLSYVHKGTITLKKLILAENDLVLSMMP